MQIELIGCTSAGKSSLAGGILLAARGASVEIRMADEHVLKRWRLQWLTSRPARTLVMDVLSLLACITTWRQNGAFLRFALGVVWRLPVGPFQKANLARNVAKRVGIHAMIGRHSGGKEVVVVDEGTLQSVHSLFVHVSIEAAAEDVARFAKLVPLPDVAVYVTQGEQVLVERTLQRGHTRIPDPSRQAVGLFVKRAITAFDRLWQEAVRGGRMSLVGREDGVVIGARHQEEAVRRAVNIIRAGIDAGYCSNARGPSGFSAQALRKRVVRTLRGRARGGRRQGAILLVTIVALLLVPWSAQARLIQVPGDAATIQKAIKAAVDGDTVARRRGGGMAAAA